MVDQLMMVIQYT
jgi:hypothetical protein